MEQYIPKSTLVVEIENRIDRCNTKKWSCPANTQVEALCDNKISAYKEILSFLYTTEVKNVNLDFTKEVDMWVKDNGDTNGFFNVQDLAKYFFELGTRINNPITATDRGIIEEIIVNLKRVENDYRIDLTKEIGWLRNISACKQNKS